MTIIEMLQNEIDGIKKEFLDKWTFTRNDAVSLMIGIQFEDHTTHFILPNKNSTLFLMERLKQIPSHRWNKHGKHKTKFIHPLDNSQPFITNDEFHIE